MKSALATITAMLLLAGCATTSGLGTAADRLDSSAHRFYEEVSYRRGAAHTTDDAAALAQATRDFRRAVDRSRSHDDLQLSFDRVSENFHHLRSQIERRDSRYGEATLAFERVTDAYLDVDRAMNHSGSRHYPH